MISSQGPSFYYTCKDPFPNKVTSTFSRDFDEDISFGGPPFNPSQELRREISAEALVSCTHLGIH